MSKSNEKVICREYGKCEDCVFVDNGDCGYGASCNLGNDELFDNRYQTYSSIRAPCYDRRDIDDMKIMLEKDDSVKRII